jgi:aspartate oxidase
MDDTIVMIGILVFAIVYFTFKGFEQANKFAENSLLVCFICKKRIKLRQKILAKAEKLKAKKRK